ncbi:SIS domain-containing protein [Pseudovibrio sp. Tun.PSC04-5.I4]|uniref:MurR/RpiR family transcriptional regulator n=1 Tax=Pseudovibrio sp. Tun.PSC04-5.I4 TaxID=1798213 RepID=UPI0008926E59|nr:SIS domain-containing protein [Pseudovibrio sp. Tun.PSC04-5.I4]SDQ15549.1 DNA-binding transcriptional regulator, MurR/RpiR family, contains HTH and SIS domains [Pseudovibrio sp. Tun.PSC04-5.I4]
MIKIDFDALNPLELRIHSSLSEHSKTVDTIRIAEAANLCDCSVSKISKFAKKLGFSNYKQYLDFLYGKKLPETNHSSELTRLQHFIEGFDSTKVSEIAELINASDKLVLLGYGPSYLCAQYFEYKLKVCTNKVTIAVPDELSAFSMTDEKTLLLIFTVTGTFKSFEEIYQNTKEKGGDVAIIVEEYNPSIVKQFDKIFCLTNDTQPSDLRPYEKTRTLFFIFMEEVIRELMRQRTTKTLP